MLSKFFRYFLVMCILGTPLLTRGADEGKPAPEFRGKLFDGEDFSSSSEIGKVVIIHFWATWCDACKTEMPLFETYYQKHIGEGLIIIGVNMDTPKDEAKARAMMKDFSFKSSFAKGAHYKSYGRIWRLPLTFVIDRKGILRKDGWVTSHILNADDLEKVITPLLKTKL